MEGTLPSEIARAVADTLGEGTPDPIVQADAVGGGCIHPALHLMSASGREAFLKWSPDPGDAGFADEASALRELGAAGGPPVAEVLGFEQGGPTRQGWLLLEWIEPGAPSPDTKGELGAGLARLHRPLPGAPPGWSVDNRIGPLSQINPENLTWPRFWAGARLAPQWERARREGRIGAAADPEMERLLADMETALAGWEQDGICLLHGDLWSGNVLVSAGGSPYLVDPASYRGHREVDLAMMELFGGFGTEVWSAYAERRPVLEGFREVRCAVYTLYPLLVHLNLFGGGYAERTLASLRQVVAALYA